MGLCCESCSHLWYTKLIITHFWENESKLVFSPKCKSLRLFYSATFVQLFILFSQWFDGRKLKMTVVENLEFYRASNGCVCHWGLFSLTWAFHRSILVRTLADVLLVQIANAIQVGGYIYSLESSGEFSHQYFPQRLVRSSLSAPGI